MARRAETPRAISPSLSFDCLRPRRLRHRRRDSSRRLIGRARPYLWRQLPARQLDLRRGTFLLAAGAPAYLLWAKRRQRAGVPLQ